MARASAVEASRSVEATTAIATVTSAKDDPEVDVASDYDEDEDLRLPPFARALLPAVDGQDGSSGSKMNFRASAPVPVCPGGRKHTVQEAATAAEFQEAQRAAQLAAQKDALVGLIDAARAKCRPDVLVKASTALAALTKFSAKRGSTASLENRFCTSLASSGKARDMVVKGEPCRYAFSTGRACRCRHDLPQILRDGCGFYCCAVDVSREGESEKMCDALVISPGDLCRFHWTRQENEQRREAERKSAELGWTTTSPNAEYDQADDEDNEEDDGPQISPRTLAKRLRDFFGFDSFT
jgi:hypothetical protein